MIATLGEASFAKRPIAAAAPAWDRSAEDWTSLPVDQEANLGLGLGSPDAGRRTSRSSSACAYIVLPVNKATQAYEVLLQLSEKEMACVAEDTGLQPFLA